MIALMFAALAVLGVLGVLGAACAARAWLRDQAAERAAFALEVHHVKYLPVTQHLPAPATEGGYTLPIRGDAQGRDVRVRAGDSRPAARADVTGSLSPRPHEEGARPLSAPPAGHTLLPAPATEEVTPSAPVEQSSSELPASGLRLHVTGRPGQPGKNTSDPAGRGTERELAIAHVAAQAGGARPSPALPKESIAALDAGWAIARGMTAVTW